MDQDIVSLSGGDVNNFGLVWLDVDTINSNNSEGVVFQVDVLGNETTDVDQSHVVGGVRLDRPGTVHGTVEKKGVRNRFGTGRVVQVQELVGQGGDVVVVPFGDGEDDFLVELVLVRVFRVSDDESTSHTVHVLTLGVRVVPVGTLLVWDGEVVGHGGARWDFTLGQVRHTVESVGAFLEKTVEMHGGVCVRKLVVHLDNDSVALVDHNVRPWVLAVTGHNVVDFGHTVWITVNVGDIPLVGVGRSQCAWEQSSNSSEQHWSRHPMRTMQLAARAWGLYVFAACACRYHRLGRKGVFGWGPQCRSSALYGATRWPGATQDATLLIYTFTGARAPAAPGPAPQLAHNWLTRGPRT